MRDPFILEPTPDRFVLFGTTDDNPWSGRATGFDCYISDDLMNWNGPFPAFRPPAGFWSDTQFWAPEVHAHDGRFYLFATFANSAHTRPRGVAVLVSDEATGPFEPWSDGPVTPDGHPCVDGTLHMDADGDPWLIYGRGAEGTPGGETGISDGEMYALRLAADLKGPAGTPRLLFAASSADWSVPLSFPDGVEPPKELNLAKDPRFTDGPFVVQSPGSPLRMLWSSHGKNGYTLGVATSESGMITGPWVQRKEPLWAGNGGHGMILHMANGRNCLVFHAPNETPNERVALIDVKISPADITLLSGTDTALL
ncbi:glycoside hydrolase family 43 protein [Paenarthrobacter nitroguajacolicus]|uniref:glycoside hydrolase family 43 protein n=1 Tax=Paenarthrobacter nitroguajacolicus TaxID=211146 RepID=UPI003D1AAA2F